MTKVEKIKRAKMQMTVLFYKAHYKKGVGDVGTPKSVQANEGSLEKKIIAAMINV